VAGKASHGLSQGEKTLIIDDANVGIEPGNQTILQMGITAKLSKREWSAVLVGCGMGLFGVAMVVLAFVDPDPTSKLGLMVASGTVLAASGGFAAIRVLTHHKPPRISVSKNGFEVTWD
jgi:VIT1/CCC1 family predicted Fe2+/Mn2+ transporter